MTCSRINIFRVLTSSKVRGTSFDIKIKFVFPVALDEQVQVGINSHNFLLHLLTTLVSLTCDVVIRTRTVLIRQIGTRRFSSGMSVDYFSDSGKQY